MDQSSSTTVDARRWSESVLELPENWDARDVLLQLTEADYSVSADQLNAMQLLLCPTSMSMPAGAVDEADFWGRLELADRAVTVFSETFFEISPIRRRQEWNELLVEADEFPQLQDWLLAIEPALGLIKVPPTGDDSVDRFVKLCCEAYLARGRWQARQRQAITHLYCQEPQLWEQVVQYLQMHYPAFIGIVAPWIETLQTTQDAQLAKFEPIFNTTVTIEDPPKRDSGRMVWIIALSIVFAIIREVARFDSPSPRVSDSPIVTPSYRQGQYIETDPNDLANPNNLKRVMSEDVRKLLLKYATELRQGNHHEVPIDSKDDPEAPADALHPNQL